MICYKCNKPAEKLYEWHYGEGMPKACHYACAPKPSTEMQKKALAVVENMLIKAEIKDNSWKYLEIEKQYLDGKLNIEDVYKKISCIFTKEESGIKKYAQWSAFWLACNTEHCTSLIYYAEERFFNN